MSRGGLQEWRSVELAEISQCPIVYGIVQPGPNIDCGVPYINSGDVGCLDLFRLARTSTEIAANYPRSRVVGGDLVIALRGEIGRCAVVPDELSGANLARGVAVLRPLETVNPRFLRMMLDTAVVKRQMYRATNGSALREIPVSALRKIEVSMPPSEVQAAIVDVVTSWDQAIDTCTRLIENARHQKRALAQQLLTGKRRLPGFDGAWPEQSIGRIAERIQRRGDGGEHPILMISSTRGWVRQDEMYARYMAGESARSYILLRRGEFAYNKGNSKSYPCGCVFPLAEFDSGLVPHVYFCFKFTENIDPVFYQHYFEANLLDRQLRRVINTGVRNNGLLNLRPADFFACEVPVPPLEEQQAIARVLTQASDLVRQYERQRKLLELEKRALMQQLLTGRRRLPVSGESDPVRAEG